jgi:acetyl/propionyl-CoA carboxylase alpha subunit/acetyl-CoA carboxylase carboxyltransferase component
MIERLLIANRGEIAIRIAEAAAELGMRSVAIAPRDDAASLHLARADEIRWIDGRGAAAYLDIAQVVRAAREAGCQAIHPGYGFLSENATFAERCADAGLTFVGPEPAVLALFGDKTRARDFAREQGVPVLDGTRAPATPEGLAEFLASLGPGAAMMIKAVAGGGGRGMRVVTDVGQVRAAFEQCTSEARAAFGDGAVYGERLLARARHIEVQIVGDGSGAVSHLGERDCTLQRRHQKLVEMSPSPGLPPATREALCAAAVRLAEKARYTGLGTFEFLVETPELSHFVFIEANPRLQVEHTVTEASRGVDLVQAQLRIAAGARLETLGLAQHQVPAPRGFALQVRLNVEGMDAAGLPVAAAGTITAYDMPMGAGLRVDGCGYVGYATHPSFDSLLAKLVVSVPLADGGDVHVGGLEGRLGEGPAGAPASGQASGYAAALGKALRALGRCRVGGVDTNRSYLIALLAHPEVRAGRFHTRFVEDHAGALAEAAGTLDAAAARDAGAAPGDAARGAAACAAVPGARDGPAAADGDLRLEDAEIAIGAPMAGAIVRMAVAVGDRVRAGTTLAVIEAMKMEHRVVAPDDGVITRVLRAVGDGVRGAAAVLCMARQVLDVDAQVTDGDREQVHHDALEVMNERRRKLADTARPEAVARLRKRGSLTPRERIAALVDAGSFTEIGDQVRHEHLGFDAPGDGILVGTARIDGRPVAVVAQDFSVFGGSNGHLGGAKHVRIVRIALRHGLPLVWLLDGGGHRIEDGQNSRAYANAGPMFQELCRLSGWVPVVACLLGAGFAANTNYSALASFVVMVRDKATMGIAGPALVKAGTGEVIGTEALGGAAAQVDRHGLADIGVDSEEAALAAARRFLSYLPSNAQAAVPLAPAPDEEGAAAQARAEALLHAVPANTRRSYDVRPVIDALADEGSVFELKPTYARNLVTAFARLAGRPVGIIANQALVAAGTLDAPACEKGAHFVALCDAFGLPLIYLMDVPGFLIGSQAEDQKLGRRSARLLYELGHATVPRVSVVLRKGYGLGYYAMCGGRSFEADACFAWPTAEICAMSVEGSVDVAYRKDYEKAGDPAARRQQIIASIRAKIGPLQAAEGFGIDDLIDPRSTRRRLIEVLERAPARRDLAMPAKFRSISPI